MKKIVRAMALALCVGLTFSSCASLNGANGKDGKQVEFRAENGVVQWRYEGEETWNDLYEYTNGADGENGVDGADGENGKEVEFRAENGVVEWRYKGSDEWNVLYEYVENIVNKAQVFFDLNGGKLPEGMESSVKLEADSEYTLPIPTKEGYEFLGWYTSESAASALESKITVKTSMMLTAKWEKSFAAYDGYTRIYSAQDLAAISEDLYGNYVLMNDIDCNGLPITLGQSADAGFAGIFDGRGFTISNYTVTGDLYQGLFGYSSGTIRNVQVKKFDLNVTQTSGTTGDLGGLVGYNTGVVENCFASGSVKLSLIVDRAAGLLVGSNTGTIRNCYANGSVRVNQPSNNWETPCAGGIVGYSSGRVLNCYANANVYAYGQRDIRYGTAGGIVGEGIAENCFAMGVVEGGRYAGAIFGRGSASNCFKAVTMQVVNETNTGDSTVELSGLSQSAFYEITLGWDDSIWNYENLDFEMGYYPTLKF